MRPVIGSDVFGYVVGNPPKGCKLCYMGSKVVIFITGLCYDNCYYCPISLEKRGRDVIYVNEEKVDNLMDIIVESHRISAKGAGITGGDPIVVFNRTISVIELLKSYFGSKFHIHLYTTGKLLTREWAKTLERRGLDELRIHIIEDKLLKKTIEFSRELNIDVGVEIPVIPNEVERIKWIIKELDKNNVSFINLNELEVSITNIAKLKARGFKPSEKRFMAVEGSHEAALEIIKWAQENTRNVNVHYCPVAYKDRYQLRLRILRKAIALSKQYEEVTNDGTLLYAILRMEENIPIDDSLLHKANGYYKTHILIAEELLNRRLIKKYEVIEEYPTVSRRILRKEIITKR